MTSRRFQETADRLQHEGQKVLAIVSEYLCTLSERPIVYSGNPGDLAKTLPAHAPQQSRQIEDILDDVRAKIFPGLGNWQHPGFLSFYPSSTSVPAILSEIIIGTVGSVGLQWSANPIGMELECVVMNWLMDMLGAADDSPFRHTSEKGGGIIQNTAGEALAITMVAARVALST